MSYYLRQYPMQSGLTTEVWKIDPDTAFRVGITNPTVFKQNAGETVWDALRRMTGWFGPNGESPFHEAKLRPGEFYPRMARPIDQHPAEAPGRSPDATNATNYIAVSRGQLTALMRQLDRIRQTVQPTENTYDTFGHDIRNFLILACTEVESHWRGVLVANGVKKNRTTTADYVALRAAMRLDEYAVDFPNYPWLQPLKPFEGWGSTDSPTRDLQWYHAYNAVKHNREDDFERATLRHAFEAVTACAIMIAAQFGRPHGLGQRTDLEAFFHFSSVPVWPLSEVYIYPYGENPAGWSPVQFSFQNTPSGTRHEPATKSNLLANGEKFALVAIETRSEVDLPPTELTPGLWASSTSMVGLDQFWATVLGTSKIDNFRSCTLTLLVKEHSTDPAIDQALRDRVWLFYAGMLLAGRFGTDQEPFLISGECKPDGLNIRQVDTLEAARHAAANQRHRLTTDEVRRGAAIGQVVQSFPWIGASRLNRVLSLYLEARTLLDWMDRIHQYTRCLDGLTIPPGGGTGKKFADRMTLIAGTAHRNLFEELYAIRGAIEHLRENDYTEPFDRAGRIDLVKNAGMAEQVARSALVHILETPPLWPHFKTKASLLAFWDLPLADREKLWGRTIDLMDGIAGFDETQHSDAELGKT